MQKAAFKEFTQAVVRTYDVTRMPKWWRPEILRTYCFLVAYLDRNIALVPADLRKEPRRVPAPHHHPLRGVCEGCCGAPQQIPESAFCVLRSPQCATIPVGLFYLMSEQILNSSI